MAVSWRSVWPKAMGRLRPNASGQRKAAWTEWLSKPSIVDARGGLKKGGKEEEAERVGNGGRWSRARRAVKGTGAGLGSGRWRAAAFGCTSRVGPARRAWDRRRQDRETLPCRVPDEAEASQENVSEGARDQPRAWLGLSIQLVGRPSARLATPSPAGGLGVSSPADHEGPCLLQPAKSPQSSTRKPATARSNIVPAKASSAGVGQLTVRTTSVFLPAGTARSQEGSAACQHWRHKATLLGASDAAGCGAIVARASFTQDTHPQCARRP
jgi:hypothetical protein